MDHRRRRKKQAAKIFQFFLRRLKEGMQKNQSTQNPKSEPRDNCTWRISPSDLLL
jgi:hypothetical protein